MAHREYLTHPPCLFGIQSVWQKKIINPFGLDKTVGKIIILLIIAL